MKNVMFILVLLGGFAISVVNAQTCKPCPPCPACPLGCCMVASADATKAATATAQVWPVSMNGMASCTPEAMAACQDKKMSKKEIKACQASCTKSNAPACQSAGAASTKPAEVIIDEKYHQSPKPMKG